jgi:site-specific recombinase XerD
MSQTPSPQQFIIERRVLMNVTPASVAWYQQSFKRFERALDSKAAVIARVAELREAGLSPVSVNVYLRAVNAYFTWLHKEHGRDLIRIPKLKEEQKILVVFSSDQISRIISCKPVARNETRVWVMAVTALDSGLRLKELTNLTQSDVDFENLVLKVRGKGNKQRLVPMSLQLRKILFRHLNKHPHEKMFATSSGLPVTSRNAQRDFKILCRKLALVGVRTSFHTLRHTFAVNYLKAGGNLYYLQRILGHSTITTTERYLRSVGIEDSRKVHEGLSLLSDPTRR